jgi:hypothetical protein
MRYMLTGDHWGAEEAYRMGIRAEDFIEGRKAEAEGRPPVYQGK